MARGVWARLNCSILKAFGTCIFLLQKVLKNLAERMSKHVIGIDRGLRFLAVTYDEHGKTEFTRGKQILRKRHSFLKVRQQLQAKCTKSAKRVLKRLSERENRWMSDVNHCLSKTLVEKYGSNTLFVLEDLTGISFEETNLNRGSKANNDLRSWAFYQLEQFLAYKARERCSEVLKVSARLRARDALSAALSAKKIVITIRTNIFVSVVTAQMMIGLAQ